MYDMQGLGCGIPAIFFKISGSRHAANGEASGTLSRGPATMLVCVRVSGLVSANEGGSRYLEDCVLLAVNPTF